MTVPPATPAVINPQILPPAGRIDLHSHLLPGIDDGCTSLAESLECVRALIAAGYSGTVCTPHVILSVYPKNTPEEIAKRVAELREQLQVAGLEYALWPGGELRIDAETISWMESVGVPTLGPGRAVLIDWWGDYWPDFAEDICHYLLGKGYQPILAHPERMGFADSKLITILESLVQAGVYLQGNFNSLSGGEGAVAEQWVRRLLDQDAYYLMALDMHRPNTLPSRLAGVVRLETEFGAEKTATFLEQRPRELMLV